MRSMGRVVDFRQCSLQRGFGGPTYYFLNMKVVIYKSGYSSYDIDVRDIALEESGRNRVTGRFVANLRENNCGLKILFEGDDYNGWDVVDYDDLDFDC